MRPGCKRVIPTLDDCVRDTHLQETFYNVKNNLNVTLNAILVLSPRPTYVLLLKRPHLLIYI